jgi:hypothetical protein
LPKLSVPTASPRNQVNKRVPSVIVSNPALDTAARPERRTYRTGNRPA